MMKLDTFVLGISVLSTSVSMNAVGQCTSTNATSCACLTTSATDCDLLPDITISWDALQHYASGPNEYSQTSGSDPGRLRLTGATPNLGHGALEVRGVNGAGYRKFICGPDTTSIYAPTANTGFTCSNGFAAKQILYQRIYHKNANVMSYQDIERGTMTYHSGHGHYHINNWSSFTLRIAQPGITDPHQWPIVASGGKLGFCLINLLTCSGNPGYCRTSHLYNQGTTLTNADFGSNYALGDHWTSCGDDAQGIDVGKGDIYSESLDGMWINLLPGLCNGQYYIVAEVDPANDFIEENEANNFTDIPWTISLQTAANSGGTANIFCDGSTVLGPGQTRTLTASPGSAYNWSTGATSRSITVASAGTYSCTVTCPCGSLSTPSLALTSLAAPVAPVGTGTTILGPGAANISATGTDVHWFNAATNGAEVGAGNNFTTPLISSTTSYWAEARNTAAGQNLTVGRAANTIQGSYSSTKQWLTFDANVPFKLQSFKVQANSTGQRHFVMVDRLGNLIAEKYIEIPAGLNTITVNWDVPAGVQHKISAFDDNTEVVRDLWINTSGVAYPYPIGTLGAITGSTGGSSTYYYLYDWVVTTPSVVAASARTQVTATVTIVVTVAPKVFLEGPYDNVSGLMRDDLRVAGLVPLTEPYTALGYAQVSGGGGETTTTGMLATTGNTAVVDWILLELRNSVTPSTIVATRCGLLLRNGSIIAADGSSIRFVASAGNYFVSVRHRNHLGCMIAAATSLNTTTTPIDFSNSATSTWGSSARKQIGSTMVLWAGQTTVDGVVKYTGTNNDRDPILLDIGGAIPTNTVNGYMGTDVNLDGVVKYTGIANDRDPILINIGGAIPTNTLIEQLP